VLFLPKPQTHVNALEAYRTEGKIKDNEFDLPSPENKRVELFSVTVKYPLLHTFSYTSSMRKYCGHENNQCHDSGTFTVFSASE
jgi:hypothetical protein